MSFKKKFKYGVSWTFVNQAHSVIIKFTLGIWLARILGPAVFGTLGMIAVFSGAAALMIDFGFSAALIQKKNVTQTDYSTVFWFNMLLSCCLYLLFYFGSYLIADFFAKDDLVLLVKVIAIKFILSAFSLTQRIQLTKRIDFKSLTLIAIVSSTTSTIVALILAYLGFGVWAVVFQILIEIIIEVILLRIQVNWVPSFVFSRESFSRFYSFGMNVTANSFLNYFSRNFDNFLIGRLIGDAGLGIYTKAYGIILFPVTNLSSVIKKVLFPSFSLIQSNVSEIKSYYLKVTNFIAFLGFPLMGFVVIKAEQMVLVFLGEKWLEMIPLLEIFGFLGMVQSLLTLNGTIYLSQGRPNLAFRVGLFSKTVLIGSIVLGLYMNGLLGVAYGLLASQIICFYPTFITAAKLINLSLKEQFSNLSTILYSLALSMGLLYFLPGPENLPEIVDLLLSALLFSSVYLASTFFFKVETLFFFLRIFRQRVLKARDVS